MVLRRENILEVNLYLLHGFLGLPSDWDGIVMSLRDTTDWHIERVDLYSDLEYVTEGGANFWVWAQKFNERVRKRPGLSFVLGYSLGGRLALHALLLDPQIWSGGVLVSTHPGLEHEVEKAARRDLDAIWGKRILSDDWHSLMTDWEGQKVFKESLFRPDRQEKAYDRKKIALQLKCFTLGLQDNLAAAITQLDLPLLWLTGEADQKFTKLSQRISRAHPKIKSIVIPGAGHRLPWEKVQPFMHAVIEFILANVSHSR